MLLVVGLRSRRLAESACISGNQRPGAELGLRIGIIRRPDYDVLATNRRRARNRPQMFVLRVLRNDRQPEGIAGNGRETGSSKLDDCRTGTGVAGVLSIAVADGGSRSEGLDASWGMMRR